MVDSVSLGVFFLHLVGAALGLGGGESEGKVGLESFAIILSLGYYVEPPGNKADSARWQ